MGQRRRRIPRREQSGSGAAEDEAGDVVGLAGGAHEIFDTFHEELQSLLGVEIGKAPDNVKPAIVGKFFAGSVEGFDDAVGEEDKRVAGLQRDFGGREGGFGGDAERESGGFKAFGGRICAADYGRVVTGVDVGKAARSGIELCEDGGGEALAAEAVGASVVIEAGGECAQREAYGGDGTQAGLKRGHQQSGWNAFAGDVGHDEHEFAAGGGVGGGIEGVIVIAGDGILRAGVESDLSVRNGWRSRRNEPSLDFAGDFEIALHRDFVGELERKKQKEDKSREKLGFDFNSVVAGLDLDSGKKK